MLAMAGSILLICPFDSVHVNVRGEKDEWCFFAAYSIHIHINLDYYTKSSMWSYKAYLKNVATLHQKFKIAYKFYVRSKDDLVVVGVKDFLWRDI